MAVEEVEEVDLEEEIVELWQYTHSLDAGQARLYKNLGAMALLLEHAINPLNEPKARAEALSRLGTLGKQLMAMADAALEKLEAEGEGEE